MIQQQTLMMVHVLMYLDVQILQLVITTLLQLKMMVLVFTLDVLLVLVQTQKVLKQYHHGLTGHMML